MIHTVQWNVSELLLLIIFATLKSHSSNQIRGPNMSPGWCHSWDEIIPLFLFSRECTENLVESDEDALNHYSKKYNVQVLKSFIHSLNRRKVLSAFCVSSLSLSSEICERRTAKVFRQKKFVYFMKRNENNFSQKWTYHRSYYRF